MYIKYQTHLKVNESCDSVELVNKTLNFDDKDVITFIIYNNKIYKSAKESHLGIFMLNPSIYTIYINELVDFLKTEYNIIISESSLIKEFSNQYISSYLKIGIGMWLRDNESIYLGRL